MSTKPSTACAPADGIIRCPDGDPPSKCSLAQAALSAGAKYCPECGSGLIASNSVPPNPVEDGADQSAPPEPSAEPTHDSSPAPRCSPPEPDSETQPDAHHRTIAPCGHEVATDALFCAKCGTRVGEVPPRYVLKVEQPGADSTTHGLDEAELTVGKDPACDIVVSDDPYMSRHHARLVRSDGLVYLEDLKSSNGTMVRVRHPVVLEAGDEMVLGTTLLRLELEA